MAKLTIDTGTAGNPATGDTLRTAMTKVNANFDELYIGLMRSDSTGGLLTTDVTNGDVRIQPNGVGIIEIDKLKITDDDITSLVTNGNIAITGNGTGGVTIEGITFNGTSLSSADSTQIQINEQVDLGGNKIVNLADPTADQHAATKAYVDTQLSSSDHNFTFVGDDSTGTAVTQGETFKFAGTQNITTAVSGDTLTITGPDLSSYATTSYVDAQNQSQALTFVGDDSTGTAVNSGETFKIAGTQNITTAVSGDTLTITGPDLSSYATTSYVTHRNNHRHDVRGDDSTGTAVNSGETFKIAGTQNITTAVSGDTLTITGPDLSNYLQNTGTQTIDNLSFNDNIISTSSNADLILDPGGTGDVRINTDKISLGSNSNLAGQTTQGANAVAVGGAAGYTGQGGYAVAVGPYAGQTTQGANAIAVGYSAGNTTQGGSAVAVGRQAGNSNQGDNAIAIGHLAGYTNQAARSIVINATGTTLNNIVEDTFVVKPVRNATGSAILQYDSTTGEITHSTVVDGIGFSGTSITATDSSIVNINENLIVEGTLNASTPTFASGVTVNSTLGVDGMATMSTLTVSGASSFVGTTTIDNLTFNDNIIATSSNADLILSPGGTGVVNVSNLTIDSSINLTDNVIKVSRSNDDLVLSASGTGSVQVSKIDMDEGTVDNTVIGGTTPASGTFTTVSITDPSVTADGVTITDNTISTNASNSNLELSANGSGYVRINNINFTNSGGLTGQVLKTNGSGQLSWFTSPILFDVSLIDDGTATLTGDSTTQTIDSFSASTYRSAKYHVQISDTTDDRYTLMEVNVSHDGSTAYISTFGAATNGDGDGSTIYDSLDLSADINGGNVRLRGTVNNDNNQVIKFVRRPIKV
jgi:hypothetical protein